MRRVDFRFVGLVSIALLLVCVAVRFWHDRQAGRLAQMQLRLACDLESQERFSESARCLTRYVELAPHDIDAMARLGRLLSSIPGEQERALLAWEQLLRNAPDRSESRRELVRLALAMGRYSDAQMHLARLLLSAPHDPELLTLLGQCQVGQASYAQAEATLRAAIRAAPERIEPYDRLSQLLQGELSRRAEASELLDTLVANNAQSAAAYIVRSSYHRHNGRLPEAGEDMARALALSPNDAAVLLAAADLEQSQGRWDQACEHLGHGLDADPRNSALHLAAVRLESRRGNPRAALKLADRGLEKLPSHPELLWSRAEQLIEIGDRQQATLVIEQLHRMRHPVPALNYLDGRSLFNRRQWLAAAKQFAIARQAGTLAPELVQQADHWIGRCYDMLGDFDLALMLHRQVAAAAPDWLPGRLSLAETLAAAGRRHEAVDNYRQIVQLADAPPEAWLVLVRELILQNLAEREGSRDWDEVEEALDGARRFASEPVEIAILQAEMLLARGRAADAAEVLTAARDANPQSAEAWAATVALAVGQAQWETAADLLAAAQLQCGDRVDLRLLSAQLLVETDGEAADKALVELEQDLGDFRLEERLRLLRGLGTLRFSQGRVRDAARLWSVAAQLQPEEISIRLLLLDAAHRADDSEAIARLLAEIGRFDGASHDVFKQYAEAVGLVAAARRGAAPSLAAARRSLNEALVHRPAWSRVPRLLAEIDQLEGNSPNAIEHLRQAIDLGDRTPDVLRRITELLYRENCFVEADQILRAYEERSVPFSAGLRRLANEASMPAEDNGRIVDLARRAAAELERYEDFIWLGQLLTRLRRDDQAEAVFRKAIELDGSNDSAWVALTRFLVLTGQAQRITPVLEEAAARMAAENRSLALARCFEAAEQLVKAENHYKLAWQGGAADPGVLERVAGFYLRTGHPTEADPLLRKLLAASDSRTAAWARRNLAIILAAAGDYQSFQQALELIERNLKMPASNDDDRRDKARILATRSGGRDRREAQEILAVLQRRAAATPDDRLLLAEIYRASGQWPRARREMQDLLTGIATPRLMADYLEGLLESGELKEAGHWIGRLEHVEPDSQRAMRLRVRLLVMQGQAVDAVQIVDRYVRESGDPAIRCERLGWAAHFIEDIGNLAGLLPAAKDLLAAKAESTYRDWTAADPAAGLERARFLGRRGQFAAALELFEQTAEQADSQAISATADALIGSHPLTLPQLSRVRGVLDRAIERQSSAVLFVSQANLAGLAGDYPRAESLYRQALEIEPRQVSALNKLALVRSLSDGQHAEALRLVERAMEITGPEPELLDSRATIEMAAGQWHAAQGDLQDALDSRPTASVYFHLAQLLAAEGNAKSAKAALKQGHQLGLSLPALHPLEQRTYQHLSSELKVQSELSGSK